MEIFSNISEKDVTKAIVSEFAEEFIDYIESDVIIIGAGPSGLIAARRLAQQGVKTLIIESNNYLGGGFWIGGYLMNKLTVREPGERILDEIGVPYKKVQDGLFVADGPHACSKLIASAMDAGAKVINMTKFDDVIYAKNVWIPVSTRHSIFRKITWPLTPLPVRDAVSVFLSVQKKPSVSREMLMKNYSVSYPVFLKTKRMVNV